MRFRKRIFTWAVFFVLLMLGFIFLVLQLIPGVLQQNANTLAVGQVAIVDSLTVPITSPVELDNLSQEEIFALRQKAALQHTWLLFTNYKPSYDVFSGVQGGKPWWGVPGYFYYGKGEQSTAGSSEEARFILNPYLLIGLDFRGLSRWSGRGETFWNEPQVTEAALIADNFPFYIEPQDLLWWPRRSRVEVSYDLSEYLRRLNNWTARKMTLQDASFDLVAYNARDFNMNYFYVDYTASFYINKGKKPPAAIYIKQHLKQDDSCAVPGGCNNMLPNAGEFQDLRIEKLPAKVVIYLWKQKPSAVTNTPDLTYVINIK